MKKQVMTAMNMKIVRVVMKKAHMKVDVVSFHLRGVLSFHIFAHIDSDQKLVITKTDIPKTSYHNNKTTRIPKLGITTNDKIIKTKTYMCMCKKMF